MYNYEYALLISNSESTEDEGSVSVKIGEQMIETSKKKQEQYIVK